MVTAPIADFNLVGTARSNTFPTTLVSASWLKSHLADPDLVILDGSWHMPASGRDAKSEFAAKHIPGACFYDIDALSNPTSSLPHMLPNATSFEAGVESLGISNQSKIVVYDTAGLFSAARVWWSFRAFGHQNIAVLDGGLPAWEATDGAIDSGTPCPPQSSFTATFKPEFVRSKAAVLTNLANEMALVLDARGADRFSGSVPEPREGLRSGHIPKSQNVHYASLLNADGTFKTKSALKDIFKQVGATPKKPIIASCGSGVTACIIDLALEHIGHEKHAVYDGSWAEWGAADDTPVATA